VHVFTLTKPEWARLYKEVMAIALRMTYRRDPKLQYTARDRAQEAVHRAFERFLRVKPAEIQTLEQARDYLVGATRSALGHEKERYAVRKETEDLAAREEAALTGGAAKSAEELHLAKAQTVIQQSRAVRLYRRLRARLRKAKDVIALGTIDCIADGKASPEEQARILGVAVEQIYAARKRRKRVMDQLVAEYRDGESDPDDEEPT
jgi:tellurite resistance protein